MLLTALCAFVCANALFGFLVLGGIYTVIFAPCLIILICSLVSPFTGRRLPVRRHQQIKNGVTLLKAFLIAGVLSCGVIIGMTVQDFGLTLILLNAGLAAAVLAAVFWDGIIRIYISSVQLGIKWRVIGAVCGMIPIVNLIVLIKLISLSRREYIFETEKAGLNSAREEERICATRYPLLLVHGVFFRDFERINYWGRIPAELEKNGAVIYYGRQSSALSVADSAAELKETIENIVSETGCGKVNIIAHSKGGLDSRFAISRLGCDRYTASLTTVNTPHRGCKFADYLLSKAGEGLRAKVSAAYNAAAKKLGDPAPDFISAVTDLTFEACGRINEECPDMPGVVYQSIGSRCVKAGSGKFPLNLTYLIAGHFEGDNDGLVSVESMKWGESFTEYKPAGDRGISHGDMIDLNRENIDGFDVRESYVQLVSALKERGL